MTQTHTLERFQGSSLSQGLAAKETLASGHASLAARRGESLAAVPAAWGPASLVLEAKTQQLLLIATWQFLAAALCLSVVPGKYHHFPASLVWAEVPDGSCSPVIRGSKLPG